MLDTLKAIQPNMTHSLARLERPPRKLLHVTHPSRIVKAVAAAKFFFSYFRRFSSTTSFEEKVRIVNNLSDSLTDDKRKYSRNFLATTRQKLHHSPHFFNICFLWRRPFLPFFHTLRVEVLPHWTLAISPLSPHFLFFSFSTGHRF